MVEIEFDFDIEDLTDIDSMVIKVKELKEAISRLEKVKDTVNNKIKTYMKERRWDRFFVEGARSTIIIQKLEKVSLDKALVKSKLNEDDYERCLKRLTYEKMSIKSGNHDR